MFLVYGTNGWIGGQLTELLSTMDIPFVVGTARLDNYADVKSEIEKVNPTHVISFTGRTHGSIDGIKYTTIDYLEQPGKLTENVRDNLCGPLVLAHLSKSHGFHFTYLGTGCIFQFDDAHPYGKEINGFDESALPNFFGSQYSVVKGFTDRMMHMYDDSVLNVRIRMPITADLSDRNFITKILRYAKVCSVPNSMTVLPELLPVLLDMIQKKQTGTVNLVNPGLVSHNEILEMYKEHVDPEFTWANFTVDEQNAILAAGRSNNYLDTTRLRAAYPNIKHIRDSVRDTIIAISKSGERVTDRV